MITSPAYPDDFDDLLVGAGIGVDEPSCYWWEADDPPSSPICPEWLSLSRERQSELHRAIDELSGYQARTLLCDFAHTIPDALTQIRMLAVPVRSGDHPSARVWDKVSYRTQPELDDFVNEVSTLSWQKRTREASECARRAIATVGQDGRGILADAVVKALREHGDYEEALEQRLELLAQAPSEESFLKARDEARQLQRWDIVRDRAISALGSLDTSQQVRCLQLDGAPAEAWRVAVERRMGADWTELWLPMLHDHVESEPGIVLIHFPGVIRQLAQDCGPKAYARTVQCLQAMARAAEALDRQAEVASLVAELVGKYERRTKFLQALDAAGFIAAAAPARSSLDRRTEGSTHEWRSDDD
jgi:tetratricopeptide (TPR) repeat protein